MKGDWKAYVIIALIIAGIAAVYFTFFFYHSCNDFACYYELQKQCSKVKFINDAEDTTWKYIINGKTDSKCEIEVTALEVKTGGIDKQILNGNSMICLLPLQSTATPESDLSRCSGKLKENLQDLLIQKLHAYIVENVGQIGQELQNLEEI